MRFPAIAAGAIAITTALIPASALAAPTIVRPGLADVGVYGVGNSDSDLDITYKLVSCSGSPCWSHFVTDQAGIEARPGDFYSCIQQGPNTAECPDTTSPELENPSEGGQGESFTILLRGGSDSLYINSAGDFEANGGAGADTLIGNNRLIPDVGYIGDNFSGGNGNDFVSGREGPDFISGGKGRDRLLGGGGNDDINAKDGTRDRKINCGAGNKDDVLMDKIDPRPRGCEKVTRV